ncbi:MAG: hypothetical protein E7253_00685 [Lachnospiraceae bacterium]|nr:hypothetical protein [Lachnospiraceae bacterium]
MGFKFIENILDKIADYLPDDEPATEQERIYEEAKQRIYEMHQKEESLFYADAAWIRGGKGKVYGETANGHFAAGDVVKMLDVQANLLMEGEILAIERVSDGSETLNEDAKKLYLIFDSMKIQGKEDFFARTYYVIKKH